MSESGYTQEFLMSPETFARRIRRHCEECTDLINSAVPCYICDRPVTTACHWLFHLFLHCECCHGYMKQREREEGFQRFVDPPCVNRADRGKLSPASPQSSPGEVSFLAAPDQPPKPEVR